MEGNYVYPPYANAIGWFLFAISLVVIPGEMIYEFIQAWRKTKYESNRMPHYLRMLTYASKPESNWGPARKENRFDRYECIENVKQPTTETNKAFNIQYDVISRL